MAHIEVMAPLGDEFFGGKGEFTLAAGTIFALVALLDRLSPGFAEEAPVRCAFAIDGVLAGDWSAPIPEGAQLLLLPRVGGG